MTRIIWGNLSGKNAGKMDFRASAPLKSGQLTSKDTFLCPKGVWTGEVPLYILHTVRFFLSHCIVAATIPDSRPATHDSAQLHDHTHQRHHVPPSHALPARHTLSWGHIGGRASGCRVRGMLSSQITYNIHFQFLVICVISFISEQYFKNVLFEYMMGRQTKVHVQCMYIVWCVDLSPPLYCMMHRPLTYSVF